VPEANERLGFVVASFEVGAGHVLDAQALAGALGLDPQRWTCSVERALTLLAFPRYFRHPAVHHGVCQGGQTLVRVREVLCSYASTPAALSPGTR
jgi:membrane-bound lytic murein transglycosylase F